MGAVILHMIVVEVYWIEKFVLGREVSEETWRELLWDATDVDKGVWAEAPAQSISWYFDLHDRHRARILEAIREFPPGDTLFGKEGHEVTAEWVLGHVIQHEAYHGGQVVLLHELWKKQSI
jgi:uncharacterized damage-inducible protein DinB